MSEWKLISEEKPKDGQRVILQFVNGQEMEAVYKDDGEGDKVHIVDIPKGFEKMAAELEEMHEKVDNMKPKQWKPVQEKEKVKLCYVAGPYRGKSKIAVEQNILNAKKEALEVINAGYFPVTPHLNTAGFENYIGMPDSFWLEGTMEILKRCDAIWLMEGWVLSQGAMAEEKMARNLGLEILPGAEWVNL